MPGRKRRRWASPQRCWRRIPSDLPYHPGPDAGWSSCRLPVRPLLARPGGNGDHARPVPAFGPGQPADKKSHATQQEHVPRRPCTRQRCKRTSDAPSDPPQAGPGTARPRGCGLGCGRHADGTLTREAGSPFAAGAGGAGIAGRAADLAGWPVPARCRCRPAQAVGPDRHLRGVAEGRHPTPGRRTGKRLTNRQDSPVTRATNVRNVTAHCDLKAEVLMFNGRCRAG